MRLEVLLAVAFAFALAGCAAKAPPPLTGSNLAVISATELPPPHGELEQDGGRVYRLGPRDLVDVDVFGVSELSRQEIQVDASGHISFPLAGSIEAEGMTPQELARAIESRLRGRFVRNPQVTVNLREALSQVVTVDGQVTQPGIYPVVGRMTLMRAIASARGVAEFARLSEVVVFRKVGDTQYAALYDLAAIRAGRYADPEIFANDIVMVGDSPGRRLFRDVLQSSPLFLSPIIAVLQRI